jgi:hypothetical protein
MCIYIYSSLSLYIYTYIYIDPLVFRKSAIIEFEPAKVTYIYICVYMSISYVQLNNGYSNNYSSELLPLATVAYPLDLLSASHSSYSLSLV